MSVKVPLTKPIEWANESITEIEIRDITAADLWDVEVQGDGKMRMGTLLELASVASGVPPGAMRKLSAADALTVIAEVSAFFDEPGSTPEIPAPSAG